MLDKLKFIRETLIEKMYDALSSGKITSTEQLFNFAKAYEKLSPSTAPAHSIVADIDSI